MLGGLYQSVLRAELSHRYGVAWGPIVNGQAELAGMPAELLEVFSKRTAQVDDALAVKVAEFRERQGRDPTAWERAALTREAAADTRAHKTRRRPGGAAGPVGGRSRRARLDRPRRHRSAGVVGQAAAADPAPVVTVSDVLDAVSSRGSTWTRADVIRAICDVQRPVSSIPGREWAAAVERAADQVLDGCVDLDPVDTGGDGDGRMAGRCGSNRSPPSSPRRRSSSRRNASSRGRSTPTPTSRPRRPRSTTRGLDVLQADAAAAVAGDDRLVVVVGPAGAGKTTMLARAVDDLDRQGRSVFGVAPTAKAAQVLGHETGMATDTLAKLLHEWTRPDRPPLRSLPARRRERR